VRFEGWQGTRMAHRWPPRTPKEVAESIFVILGADKGQEGSAGTGQSGYVT
jgi:hypothetical protein